MLNSQDHLIHTLLQPSPSTIVVGVAVGSSHSLPRWHFPPSNFWVFPLIFYHLILLDVQFQGVWFSNSHHVAKLAKLRISGWGGFCVFVSDDLLISYSPQIFYLNSLQCLLMRVPSFCMCWATYSYEDGDLGHFLFTIMSSTHGEVASRCYSKPSIYFSSFLI